MKVWAPFLSAISLGFLFSPLANAEIETAGSVGIEQRYFTQDALQIGQTKSQASLTFAPTFSTDIGDSGNLVFTPFARLDQRDSERTHADIRELMFSYYFDYIEVHAGIGKVFWGQTESLHLVDIINQTDTVESADGEDKLGQPMLDVRYLSDFGTFTAYVLPFFRERTFAGEDGRLRPQLLIDNNLAVYESDDEQSNIDFALRWQHSIGSWEIGLGYFDGTARMPDVTPVFSAPNQAPTLAPVYNQLNQVSLDLLYIYDSLILKAEAISAEELGQRDIAAVLGFEYTLVNIFESGFDLGVLSEYQYDERDTDVFITGQNDLMLGARLVFNDFASSELLFGFVQDLDESSSYSAFIEGATRINQNWSLAINGYFFTSEVETDPIFFLRRDDHIAFSLEYNF